MAQRVVAIVALVLSTIHVLAQKADAQAATRDPLIGVWGGGETILGPQVRGAALVERVAGIWTLRTSGFETAGAMSGDSLVLRLSGGQGTLRAWLHGETLDGFWVQPAGFDGPSYSTPVQFHRASVDAWRGDIVPMDSRLPLYLSIARNDDGSLRGVFRNPEANWPGRAGTMPIQRDGDKLVLINPRNGKAQFHQPYDSANGTILFDFGAPLVLTHRASDDAIGFYPRSPALPPYTYRTPVSRADGWRTARAASQRMDEASLRSIVRRLASADPLNDSMTRVHALLVAHHGALVPDEYFHGYSEDRLHDLRSASKTMTSIMAGAAMLRGAAFTIS